MDDDDVCAACQHVPRHVITPRCGHDSACSPRVGRPPLLLCWPDIVSIRLGMLLEHTLSALRYIGILVSGPFIRHYRLDKDMA